MHDFSKTRKKTTGVVVMMMMVMMMMMMIMIMMMINDRDGFWLMLDPLPIRTAGCRRSRKENDGSQASSQATGRPIDNASLMEKSSERFGYSEKIMADTAAAEAGGAAECPLGFGATGDDAKAMAIMMEALTCGFLIAFIAGEQQAVSCSSFFLVVCLFGFSLSLSLSLSWSRFGFSAFVRCGVCLLDAVFSSMIVPIVLQSIGYRQVWRRGTLQRASRVIASKGLGSTFEQI